MINKDDELVIICQIDENKLKDDVRLELVRKVIFDYVQVAPMYTSLLQMLKSSPQIETARDADDEDDQPTHDQLKRKKVAHSKFQNLVPDDYSPESYPELKVCYKRLFAILNSPEYLKATTKVRFFVSKFILVYQCLWNLC